MDAEEIRKLSADAERKAANLTGFDRDAWQAIAEQWTILARLRDGLGLPEKPGARPPDR